MLLEPIEPDEPRTGVWPLPKGQHVVLSPDLRAEWWGKWGTRGSLWCIINYCVDMDWFDAYPDFDGEAPEWFQDYDGGMEGLLRIAQYDEALEFLLHQAIAPGQAFRIEFAFASGVEVTGEGWDEFRCTVIDRERWDDQRVRFAWLRWHAAQEGR
jgi:hypothetical protein